MKYWFLVLLLVVFIWSASAADNRLVFATGTASTTNVALDWISAIHVGTSGGGSDPLPGALLDLPRRPTAGSFGAGAHARQLRRVPLEPDSASNDRHHPDLLTAPGSLQPDEYASIVAYLLSYDCVHTGGATLPDKLPAAILESYLE
jgi:hypothetical protein